MIAALFSLSVVSQAPLISRHFTVLTIIGFLSYSPWPHGLIMAAIAPDSSHLNCVQNQKDPHHPGKRKSKKEKWERQRKRDYLTVFSPFMKAKYFPRAPLLISAYLIDQNWVTWHPWNQGLSALIFFGREERRQPWVLHNYSFLVMLSALFLLWLWEGQSVLRALMWINQ